MKYVTLPESVYNTLVEAAKSYTEDLESVSGLAKLKAALAYQPTEDTVDDSEPMFMWQDRSGRGFSSQISLTAIIEDEDNIEADAEYQFAVEEDVTTDDSLIQWASNADVGEEYTIDHDHYIRIS